METPTGHINDFDFLHGCWNLRHRRLRQRWVHSDEWDEFDGTAHCLPYLSGVANIEQLDVPDRGFSGLTIRLFDLTTSKWSISWVNSTVGRLEPAVSGGFDGTLGWFVGEDTDDGRPITVRFRWEALDADHARWEQAFSSEPGEWETNWTMEFTRA